MWIGKVGETKKKSKENRFFKLMKIK